MQCSTRGRGRRSLRGGSRVLSWLKRAAGNIHSFVKKNKLLSRGGKFVSDLGVVPPQYAALLSGATKAAGAMGYGRRQHRMQRLHGSGSLRNTLHGIKNIFSDYGKARRMMANLK